MDQAEHHYFIERAVYLSDHGSKNGHGGPFGAIVVKDGIIVGEGFNMVTSSNDPSAHAEIIAIRNACKNLNTFQLTGCIIYTSCEPCPMCMGAIYWARPDKVYYANSKSDAAEAGFDDAFIYDQLNIAPAERDIPILHIPTDTALVIFEEWKKNPDKTLY